MAVFPGDSARIHTASELLKEARPLGGHARGAERGGHRLVGEWLNDDRLADDAPERSRYIARRVLARSRELHDALATRSGRLGSRLVVELPGQSRNAPARVH